MFSRLISILLSNKLVFFIFLLSLSAFASAQVTIGSQLKPKEGVLLDLKEFNEKSSGLTATKGLLLPRVALELDDHLYPMFNDSKAEYLSDKEQIDQKHTGLVVYNTKDLRLVVEIPTSSCDPPIFGEEGSLAPGFVVWNGTGWDNIVEPESLVGDPEINDNVFLLTDHEGNTYTYSKFGDAGYWMTSNLATKTAPPSINSSLNYFLWNGSKKELENQTQAFYAYPRREERAPITGDEDYKKYPSVGLLYSIGAVNAGKPISYNMQGLCPDGWYIPSSDEYKELIAELDRNRAKYTTAMPLEKVTNSQFLITDCGEFGFNAKVEPKSKKSLEGGFGLIAHTWCYSDNINYPSVRNVFEIACIREGQMGMLQGSLNPKDPEYQAIKHEPWWWRQMISLRCKKNE